MGCEEDLTSRAPRTGGTPVSRGEGSRAAGGDPVSRLYTMRCRSVGMPRAASFATASISTVLPRRGNAARGFFREGEHITGLAAGGEAVAGKGGLGIGIDEARDDRPGAVAGEERQEAPADLDDRDHRNHALRIERHEHADRIAL